MRLTQKQITQIKKMTAEVFGDEVQVYLFGSRLDDQKKGGDIDLYIKTSNPVEDLAQSIMVIEAKLILALGDQKFDILLDAPNVQKSTIHDVAQQTGVLL